MFISNHQPACKIQAICHDLHTCNLSFFLHGQNFWKIKCTLKFTHYIANLNSELPIYTVNCQFFALNL